MDGLGHDGRGATGRCFQRSAVHYSSSDLALDYGYAEVFLDLACFFLMVMMMAQMLRVVIISILLPIDQSTCSHLVLILLDVLKLLLEDVCLLDGG